jgi:small-conductance mechanosensitive channel
MLSTTLFKVGPFNICIWNLVFLVIIFLGATVIRRMLSRFLKKQFKSNNIHLEGRRETYLKLFTQSVYLIALYFAVLSFRFNNHEITFEEFINYNLISIGSLKISLYSIIIVAVIFLSAKIASSAYKLYVGKKHRAKTAYDPGVEYVYVQIARYIIYLTAVLLSFNVLGLNISLILSGSVGLLVGIGLGLQDVFKDTIAGIVLLLEGNIKVGDIVEIDAKTQTNSHKGAYNFVARIIKISFRTTQIQTKEGNVIIIPNTHLTQQQVENWSHSSSLSMFTIHALIEYGSNTVLATELLKTAALGHPIVSREEPVIVRMSNFSENGIEMELVFWAENSWDIGNYKSEIRFEIDRLFREHQVHFAYPTRTIINKA